MVEAARVFMSENAELQDHMEDHVSETGWYSIEILCTALNTKAMQEHGRIKWTIDLREFGSAADLHASLGVLQNVENVHWVAYKSARGQAYVLDSLRGEPQAVSDEEFAALLAQRPGSYVIREV